MAVLAFLIRVVLLLAGLAFAAGAIFSLWGFCVCIAQQHFQMAKFWFGNMAGAGMFSYLMCRSASHLEFVLPWIFDDEQIFSLCMPKPLEERAAIALAKREGKPLASYAIRLRTLSVETAETICAAPSSHGLWFYRLRNLSENVAAILVERCRGPLDLEGLKTLRPALAECLARARGPLFLDGLKRLPDEVAEALARHAGWLALNGLTRLSPAAAAALARRRIVKDGSRVKNCLSLDGLSQLPEDVAAALVAYRGALSLGGLTDLSPNVARLFASHLPAVELGDEILLHLDGLTSLSAEAAMAIAAYPGGLSLNGLRSPEPDCLRSLTKHAGGVLSLGRLRTMPDDVAAMFAARRGMLFVPQLDEISPKARAILRSNPLIDLPAIS